MKTAILGLLFIFSALAYGIYDLYFGAELLEVEKELVQSIKDPQTEAALLLLAGKKVSSEQVVPQQKMSNRRPASEAISSQVRAEVKIVQHNWSHFQEMFDQFQNKDFQKHVEHYLDFLISRQKQNIEENILVSKETEEFLQQFNLNSKDAETMLTYLMVQNKDDFSQTLKNDVLKVYKLSHVSRTNVAPFLESRMEEMSLERDQTKLDHLEDSGKVAELVESFRILTDARFYSEAESLERFNKWSQKFDNQLIQHEFQNILKNQYPNLRNQNDLFPLPKADLLPVLSD